MTHIEEVLISTCLNITMTQRSFVEVDFFEMRVLNEVFLKSIDCSKFLSYRFLLWFQKFSNLPRNFSKGSNNC